jgi:hypothetical protein
MPFEIQNGSWQGELVQERNQLLQVFNPQAMANSLT